MYSTKLARGNCRPAAVHDMPAGQAPGALEEVAADKGDFSAKPASSRSPASRLWRGSLM
jgi:hypothetical protein